MFRFGNGLPIQLEYQFGMTGFEKPRFDCLMACHTGIRSNIEVLQVAHSSPNPIRMRVIRTRMAAQPTFRWTMTTFAGNAFTRLQPMCSQAFRNFRERGVARRAALIEGRIFDLQGVSDLFRASGGQRRERPLRMIIAHRPDEELVFLSTTVATRTRTGIRTEKFCGA